MKFLAILIGVILGICLFLGILFLIFYRKFIGLFQKLGFKVNSIGDVANEMERIKEEDSTRVKSISGMTSLLLPNIQKDFPEFNEKELYAKVESSLRLAFSAIENKNAEEVSSLPLLRDSISLKVEDYKTNFLFIIMRKKMELPR